MVYLTNAQANALFDLTKIIVATGITSFAVVIFKQGGTDLCAYLLFKRGTSAFLGDITKYKTKGKNKIVVVLLILLASLTGFMSTLLASIFPVTNYVLSGSGILYTSLISPTIPLTVPIDASNVVVGENLADMAAQIAGAVCNSTNLCVQNNGGGGTFMAYNISVGQPVIIGECNATNQNWCLEPNTVGANNEAVSIGGVIHQLLPQGQWSNYSQYGKEGNITMNLVQDVINNLPTLYNTVTAGDQLASIPALNIPGLTQLMQSYEMAIHYVTSVYNYIANDTVSVLHQDIVITQYSVSHSANLSSVGNNYTMQESCNKVIDMYQPQMVTDLQLNLQQSSAIVYYYAQTTVVNNTVLRDTCYLTVTEEPISAINVKTQYALFAHQVQNQTLASNTQYLAGPASLGSTGGIISTVYQSGTLFESNNLTVTAYQIGGTSGPEMPLATSNFSMALLKGNYALPDTIMNYVRIGGLYMPVYDVVVGPRVLVTTNLLLTIIVLNMISITFIVIVHTVWQLKYFSKPVEVLLANTITYGLSTRTSLAHDINIGISYDNKAKHITLVCDGMQIMCDDSAVLLEELSKEIHN